MNDAFSAGQVWAIPRSGWTVLLLRRRASVVGVWETFTLSGPSIFGASSFTYHTVYERSLAEVWQRVA